MAKRIGNNKMNIEWVYAKACYDALKNDLPVPPIPYYDIWEVEENVGKGAKIIGRKLIDPQRVTCNGVQVY